MKIIAEGRAAIIPVELAGGTTGGAASCVHGLRQDHAHGLHVRGCDYRVLSVATESRWTVPMFFAMIGLSPGSVVRMVDVIFRCSHCDHVERPMNHINPESGCRGTFHWLDGRVKCDGCGRIYSPSDRHYCTHCRSWYTDHELSEERGQELGQAPVAPRVEEATTKAKERGQQLGQAPVEEAATIAESAPPWSGSKRAGVIVLVLLAVLACAGVALAELSPVLPFLYAL